MHTKSLSFIALWLLSSASTAHCQKMTYTTTLSPLTVHNTDNQEVQAIESLSSATLMLDRGGMDKASVHLQIFRQTNCRLADSLQTKKSVANDKKHSGKALGNS